LHIAEEILACTIE